MPNQKEQGWEKEEWAGWKIVSDMLDHPDENGIYQTSKCYQELYDFVMAQKQKARQEDRAKILEEIEGLKKEITNELYADVEDRIKKGLGDVEKRIFNDALSQVLLILNQKR